MGKVYTNSDQAKRLSQTRIERVLAVAVVVGALATIPLVLLLEQEATPPTWLLVADWMLWGIFVVEFLVRFVVATHRLEFIKKNYVSLAVVILSLPQLPVVLSLIRLARVVRFLRLFRLAGFTFRALSGLGTILGRQGVIYVASATALIVCAGGAGLSLLEPHTVRGGFADGIWWAVVTASTVGYGDIAPTTLPGRVVAVILMLTGVGFLSTLAASITAHFLEQETAGELREIRERICRIEDLLVEIAAERSDGHVRETRGSFEISKEH